MDKSDFVHFVNSFRWHCTIFTKTTRFRGTLTGLSGEYVTFDQNGQKCILKLMAADLENWQF